MKVAATVVIRWGGEKDVRVECSSVQRARILVGVKAAHLGILGYEVVIRESGVYEAWGKGGERSGYAQVCKAQMWVEVAG